MFLLKECPNCGKKIRFPINKGKIKVRCSCGHSFVANPDNPALYKNGQIDASYSNSPKKNRRFNSKRLIHRLYDFYYQLLNFKLLTVADKKIILYRLLIGIIFIITIFLLLFFMLANR
jgi:hypothetical protein